MSRALLRNLVLGVTFPWAGTGWAAPPPLPAPASAHWQQAQELIRKGYGGRLPAGMPHDGDLDLDIGLWLTVSPGAAGTPTGETLSHAAPLFAPMPTLLSPSYLAFQNSQFRTPIQVRVNAQSSRSLATYGTEMGMLHHEGTHAIDEVKKSVRRIIDPAAAPTDLLQEPAVGFGPVLGRMLAEGDPGRAARMRTDLEAVQRKLRPESSLSSYPLLATERLAYLSEAFAGAIRLHAWKRLPENRVELYAAAYNLFRRVDLDPKERDPLSAALRTPEGREALRRFPAYNPAPNGLGHAVFHVQQGLDQLTEAEKRRYYAEVLPEDYGDVLEEVYGDPQGRAKLGLETRPNYGIAFAYHVIARRYQEADSWDTAHYGRLAEKVEPEVFLNVLRVAIQNGNVAAQRALYATFDRRFGKRTDAQREAMLRETAAAREAAKDTRPNMALTASDLADYFSRVDLSLGFLERAERPLFAKGPPPGRPGNAPFLAPSPAVTREGR
ncbi:MAG: hypothetical protein PW734_06335 [Verrucomicrobium sp.]|nr:hypothetical protein [Verrucomicrobium sp.]